VKSLPHTKTAKLTFKKNERGWGFSSVVERLPSKRKALSLVPSSEKKKNELAEKMLDPAMPVSDRPCQKAMKHSRTSWILSDKQASLPAQFCTLLSPFLRRL